MTFVAIIKRGVRRKETGLEGGLGEWLSGTPIDN